ncbi:MAG: MoxR family ATPase, partial [Mariniblastus sp.]|nr:MoxR family ATPase [Mariniblastus sp.]
MTQSTTQINDLRIQLNRALVGKEDVIELVIACLIAKGHLLFDDLPGLGKTTLAKALAQTIGGSFSRIQCTPDLLPSDVTGFNIFDQKNHTFEFKEGPVFSHLLLTDEINRATPRTQSALFEAMAERQVTIDNLSKQLPPTFMVIATQNPVESHGAYPLPEAQLDRFAMKLQIGYPKSEDEVELLGHFVGEAFSSQIIDSVLTVEELGQIQQEVALVEVCEAVRRYLVELGSATRNHASIELGLSPRGLITWQRVAQAWAFLQGRNFVIPEDVQAVAVPVLNLRISGSSENSVLIIQEIIESV